ncbi:helix-turn-helix domain-containing protein [Providencia stuartii]|nr:helix-turn-helix domain-containing protein [Providencia stuartii]UQZ14264.1 helix-turn-helix domain-containing protein [Providencia stuartii]
MNIKAKRDIAHKTKILNHARESKNIAKTCRHFGSSRETFYTWKRAYERDGEKGLINNKPCPENPTKRVAKYIEEPVIYLRTTCHFGPQGVKIISLSITLVK